MHLDVATFELGGILIAIVGGMLRMEHRLTTIETTLAFLLAKGQKSNE